MNPFIENLTEKELVLRAVARGWMRYPEPVAEEAPLPRVKKDGEPWAKVEMPPGLTATERSRIYQRRSRARARGEDPDAVTLDPEPLRRGRPWHKLDTQ